MLAEQRDLMVGDAENEGPASGLDHGDRGIAAEWLTGNDSDGTSGRSGTAASDATSKARRQQKQCDDDRNRKDQS